jgi:hypothetical protein
MPYLVRFKKERITNPTNQGENMKNLRRLGAAAVLTCVLALSAFAGEIQTPPCSSPDPGETQTPPCAAARSDMGTPAEASTPGAKGTPTLASNETLFTEIAADVLRNVLSLF